MKNMQPPDGALVTPTEPLCASAIALTIVSPSPLLFPFRFDLTDVCLNLSNIYGFFCIWNSRTLVNDSNFRNIRRRNNFYFYG